MQKQSVFEGNIPYFPASCSLSLSFRLSFSQSYSTCHFLPFIVNPFCGQRVTSGATADTCSCESMCTHTCTRGISWRRDRLTCCNLETVYCYKPCHTGDHRMCIAKRRWKWYTRSFVLARSKITRIGFEDIRSRYSWGNNRTCKKFHWVEDGSMIENNGISSQRKEYIIKNLIN